MPTQDLTDTRHLKHIVRAAHEGDGRRIRLNLQDAIEAGELSQCEAALLTGWAKVLQSGRNGSTKHRNAHQALREWASTKH